MKVSILLLLSVCVYSVSSAQTGEAYISIQSDFLTDQDTVELYYWRDMLGSYDFNSSYEKVSAVCTGGKVAFRLSEVSDQTRLSLYFSYQKLRAIPMHGIFRQMRIMPQDSIVVSLYPHSGVHNTASGGYDNGMPVFIGNWRCTYSGKGSGKFTALSAVDSFLLAFKNPHLSLYRDSSWQQRTEESMRSYDRMFQGCIDILDHHRQNMSQKEYALLYNDVLGRIHGEKTQYLVYAIGARLGKRDSFTNEEFMSFVSRLIEEVGHKMKHDSHFKVNSPDLFLSLSKLYQFSTYMSEGKLELEHTANLIKCNIDDPYIRDRVLVSLFIERFPGNPRPELYADMLAYVQDGYARDRIKELNVYTYGAEMIDFELPDIHGRYHKMSDYRGRLVLLDFWYMACIPCRAYIENVIRPLADKYRNDPNFAIILVSLDKKTTLISAVEKNIIPKDAVLLYTDNLRFMHPLLKRMKIPSYPYPMLIDKLGKRISVREGVLKNKEMLIQAIEENR